MSEGRKLTTSHQQFPWFSLENLFSVGRTNSLLSVDIPVIVRFLLITILSSISVVYLLILILRTGLVIIIVRGGEFRASKDIQNTESIKLATRTANEVYSIESPSFGFSISGLLYGP